MGKQESGIVMRIDPALSWANLFFYFLEMKYWKRSGIGSSRAFKYHPNFFDLDITIEGAPLYMTSLIRMLSFP